MERAFCFSKYFTHPQIITERHKIGGYRGECFLVHYLWANWQDTSQFRDTACSQLNTGIHLHSHSTITEVRKFTPPPLDTIQTVPQTYFIVNTFNWESGGRVWFLGYLRLNCYSFNVSKREIQTTGCAWLSRVEWLNGANRDKAPGMSPLEML